MKSLAIFSALGTLLVSPALAETPTLSIHATARDGESVVLLGPDATRQLVVTRNEGASETDVTRAVAYSAEPEGIVAVSSSGIVTPVANGEAKITAALEGVQAVMEMQVAHVETPQPINFQNEIVPLFTKHGCNGGGCHGKSGGQNGFRLSLLGFEPTEDYEYLVKEARGRRLFPAAPEHSLLLRKSTGEVPHGGGSRIERESWDYKAMVRWMQQGMPYGKADDPVVEKIAVFPPKRIVSPGAEQQLAVTATYSDGSVRDITGIASYESNEKEMAEAEQGGLVQLAEGHTGDVAVMVRFQEQVSVFQATIPLGAPVESVPDPSNFIDELVFAKLKTLGLPPSEICDDPTFLRRASVDIAGRLPTKEEAAEFAASADPDKRAKWIDRLLESPQYADYFANKWAAILRNKREQSYYERGTQGFYNWIRKQMRTNQPFSQFATDLLTAKGQMVSNPPVAWFRNVDKREEQLQDVAQMFLGVRLQCAQCHHHPYERWSQQDYYGFSAFFSRVGKKNTGRPGESAVFHQVGAASAQNIKTNKGVKPMPLGGGELEIPPQDDPRDSLAEWMTSPENPFFAKMLVNRYWKHFFSRALVEPEDDMRVTNPPTNPELLDALATSFVESGFDLKGLVRTICNSTTYQLSAIPNAYNANDRQNYSRYYPKRMTAEVLLDAIDNLTGSSTSFPGQLVGTKAIQLPDDSFNTSSYFLTVFGRPEMDSACECERAMGASLAQTLHLLNSKNIQDKLSNGSGRAAKLANDMKRPDEEKIGELYERAFAREPISEELAAAKEYIDRKRSTATEKKEDGAKAVREAYEDIVWALVNTKEFLFNH